MEPNKIETHFKKQLNSREIQPSPMAWNRLDAMLTATEEKKSKPRYGWIYIAASILGFVFLGTVYFGQKEDITLNQKNTVVVQRAVSAKTHKKSSTISNAIAVNKTVVNIQKDIVKGNKKLVSKKDSLTNTNNLNQNPVAEVSIINQKKEQQSNAALTKTLTVDELLAKVSQSTRLNNQSDFKVKVNPNELLQQVENELEPTFRENVFSKVAENFELVKEALVNRNKE